MRKPTNTMPIDYRIKENPLANPQRMNRIIKFILDNAKKDRSSGERFLKKAQAVLEEVLELERGEEGFPSGHIASAFHNVITVLSQMGKSNETLLKLVQAYDKLIKVSNPAPGNTITPDVNSSSFSLMQKITKEQEEDND